MNISGDRDRRSVKPSNYHYATKNERFSVPGERPNFSYSFGPIITEMGISFDLKMFPVFRADFRFLAPKFGFWPTVDVIEQSIHGNFHRLSYATCFRMIPGFAYLRLKMTS